MKLTDKQEKFVHVWLETGNKSEAYRQAYNTGKMKAATIERNASGLSKNNKVATRYNELKKQQVDKAEAKLQITIEYRLDLLKKAAEMGLGVIVDKGGNEIPINLAATINSVKEMNAMLGTDDSSDKPEPKQFIFNVVDGKRQSNTHQ